MGGDETLDRIRELEDQANKVRILIITFYFPKFEMFIHNFIPSLYSTTMSQNI